MIWIQILSSSSPALSIIHPLLFHHRPHISQPRVPQSLAGRVYYLAVLVPRQLPICCCCWIRCRCCLCANQKTRRTERKSNNMKCPGTGAEALGHVIRVVRLPVRSFSNVVVVYFHTERHPHFFSVAASHSGVLGECPRAPNTRTEMSETRQRRRAGGGGGGDQRTIQRASRVSGDSSLLLLLFLLL